MGKRNTRWSHRTYLRFLREGRGKGDLAEYKPWITTHDFPSSGKVARILGETTGRIHHLMSQNEKRLFLILDYDPLVSDIKEQYPLPLEDTLLIAAELGFKHPEMNGYPFVLTTDFYYCKEGIWCAVTVKPSEKLSERRILEKFDIEREYYERRGIKWSIMTEKELDNAYADNIWWLRSGASLDELIQPSDLRDKIINVFHELYQDTSIPFSELISGIEDECRLRTGTGLQIFKSLVRQGRITINLHDRINTYEPRALSPYARLQ